MSSHSSKTSRVLFCAESITLSQVVRLVVLARALDRRAYEVHFAAGAFDPVCFAGEDLVRHALPTVPAARVLRRVAWGLRPYERRTLRRYVEAELALLERLRPTAVVGDFRLSLAVSAAVARVPYLALVNAYWSPYASPAPWPVPDHPVLRVLGERTVARHLPAVLPRMLEWFAAPLDAVRAEYGLPPVGDLRAMLSAADRVLHPEVPALAPTEGRPESHHYLGVVSWSAPVPMPAAFRASDAGPPWVYVTLGSSGDARVLSTVARALSTLPVRVMIATAGRAVAADLPAGVRVAPYLPGAEAAARSAFVVCNGGSSTAYQALAQGVPVLGLPSNLDQHLAMAAIERSGAGIGVRAQGASPRAIRDAAAALLEDERPRAAAHAIAAAARAYDPGARFAAVIDDVVAGVRPDVTQHALEASGSA